MTKIEEEYRRWLENAVDDNTLQLELEQIAGKPEEQYALFHSGLAFGTGGLRGLLGAGPGRMNIYTVQRATQGYANHLHSTNNKASVAIAYDSRHNSRLFAERAAQVLAANGIDVWLYARLMPTPALSFAVRSLGCSGGICITASHNPASYNGYKVYGADGCQITTEAAAKIQAEIDRLDYFSDVCHTPLGKAGGNINEIHEDTIQAYLEAVLSCRMSALPLSGIRVVYTPLHGAGLECVERCLAKAGVADLHIVQSQKEANGNFPTCPYPNPENEAALNEGIKECQKVDADILLATDPDSDRVGVVVRHQGSYVRLSGNEVGVLLLDYLIALHLKNKTMPPAPTVIKTIVTTDMAAAVCKAHNVRLLETLTGFKFIGEQIGVMEQRKEEKNFLFGFEESCGYLPGTYVRDKDGVVACLLLCEMCAAYKAKGKTLYDAMQFLYSRYGFWHSRLLSVELAGVDGLEKQNALMDDLRTSPPAHIGTWGVRSVTDYSSGTVQMPGAKDGISLPASDVLAFQLEREAKVIIRPSGTEPKVKIYLSCCSKSNEEGIYELDELENGTRKYFTHL